LPDELEFADVRVNFARYEATRGGRKVDLTRKEFGLLRLLAAKEGAVVTRDELLEKVWGYEAMPTTRTVDNHLAALRAKLENDAAEPQYLITVHGVGYKLVR
jgi:DNA-binding response OmpR family regulator